MRRHRVERETPARNETIGSIGDGMATQRQIRASRMNATKSTGPRSAAGKAIVSRNALGHGLTARTVLLDGEDAAVFEALRRALRLEFAPRSATEVSLVEHLAGLLWRLRRAQGFEAGLLSWIAHQQAEAYDTAGVTLGRIAVVCDRRGLAHNGAVVPNSTVSNSGELRRVGRMLDAALGPRDLMSKLGRYEAHLARQIEKILAELRRGIAGRSADGPDHNGSTAG